MAIHTILRVIPLKNTQDFQCKQPMECFYFSEGPMIVSKKGFFQQCTKVHTYICLYIVHYYSLRTGFLYYGLMTPAWSLPGADLWTPRLSFIEWSLLCSGPSHRSCHIFKTYFRIQDLKSVYGKLVSFILSFNAYLATLSTFKFP